MFEEGKIKVRPRDVHIPVANVSFQRTECVGMYRMYNYLPSLEYKNYSKSWEKELIEEGKMYLFQFCGYALYEDLRVYKIEGIVKKVVFKNNSSVGFETHEWIPLSEKMLSYEESLLGEVRGSKKIVGDEIFYFLPLGDFYLGYDWRQSYSLSVFCKEDYIAYVSLNPKRFNIVNGFIFKQTIF